MDGSVCNTNLFIILAILFGIGLIVSAIFVVISLLNKETPKTTEEIEQNNRVFYTSLIIMVVCFILACIFGVMINRETCLEVFE